ncbi:hypothetical protein M2360_004633 [Rhizobium sp. SG_E_25_P2]|uniref:hypothetical protein n=1 Tax=Rhizobium sp. SG_E_25_P2 TaxID=2879942 RepID=UPI002476EE99|nr:hypothetical protein [Rhizobium sp. SG_E_25_P2]MDH6269206.1 hypothetical protein [Rhizobium sp. SG_E_25_P2]
MIMVNQGLIRDLRLRRALREYMRLSTRAGGKLLKTHIVVKRGRNCKAGVDANADGEKILPRSRRAPDPTIRSVEMRTVNRKKN